MPMQNLATNTAAVAETAPAPEPTTTYEVSVEWLPADCYMATSDDVIGLVLQADTLEEMVECMLETIPHLLELGHGIDKDKAGRISVRQLGAANPRGLTQYEIIQPA